MTRSAFDAVAFPNIKRLIDLYSEDDQRWAKEVFDFVKKELLESESSAELDELFETYEEYLEANPSGVLLTTLARSGLPAYAIDYGGCVEEIIVRVEEYVEENGYSLDFHWPEDADTNPDPLLAVSRANEKLSQMDCYLVDIQTEGDYLCHFCVPMDKLRQFHAIMAALNLQPTNSAA